MICGLDRKCTSNGLAIGLAAVLLIAHAAASKAEEEVSPPAFEQVEPAGPDAFSPWQHELWRDATPEMQAYVCSYAQRRPDWCSEAEAPIFVRPPAELELYGPRFSEDDARWLRMLGRGDVTAFNAEEAAFIRRRAERLQDPQAMEVMGFLYSQGQGVPRDPEQAYIWYGRAFLAGETQVKANMDILWQKLVRENRAAIERINLYFARLVEEG